MEIGKEFNNINMIEFEMVVDFPFNISEIISVLSNQIDYFDGVFFFGLFVDAEENLRHVPESQLVQIHNFQII